MTFLSDLGDFSPGGGEPKRGEFMALFGEDADVIRFNLFPKKELGSISESDSLPINSSVRLELSEKIP